MNSLRRNTLVIAAVFYLVAVVKSPHCCPRSPSEMWGDQAARDGVGPGVGAVNVGRPRGAPQNQSGKARP